MKKAAVPSILVAMVLLTFGVIAVKSLTACFVRGGQPCTQ